MITVIAFREQGWFETERHERRMWKQTIAAYGVDEFHLVENGQDFINTLNKCKGTQVYLVPQDGKPLSSFEHPKDVIYILGNARESLNKYTGNGIMLTIESQNNVDMFGCVAIAPVLHSHYLQHDS